MENLKVSDWSMPKYVRFEHAGVTFTTDKDGALDVEMAPGATLTERAAAFVAELKRLGGWTD